MAREVQTATCTRAHTDTDTRTWACTHTHTHTRGTDLCVWLPGGSRGPFNEVTHQVTATGVSQLHGWSHTGRKTEVTGAIDSKVGEVRV